MYPWCPPEEKHTHADLGEHSLVTCSMGTLGNPFASSGDHGGDPMFEQNLSMGFDF